MKISVIIPCRNEKAHLRRFLDAVLAQELDPGWELELLVADGMSDDGTRDTLRQYSCIQVIDNPGRIVSTGLNAAIAIATGEIIIRMDVHTTYAQDYIRQSVRVLRESGADNVGGPWIAKGEGCIGNAIAAAFRSRFCAGGGKAHDPAYEGEVDSVYLGCWPRSAFARFGLFDPVLVRNQDDEFNFRLQKMGGRIWQSPCIKSSYNPRNSVAALFRQYLQYGFWKVAVIKKHGALPSWRHLAPVVFVSSILIWGILTAVAWLSRLSPIAIATLSALEAEVAVYCFACIASTVPFIRLVNTRTLLLMPGIIAVYHTSWGLGFLIGVVTQLAPKSKTMSSSRFFTSLTR